MTSDEMLDEMIASSAYSLRRVSLVRVRGELAALRERAEAAEREAERLRQQASPSVTVKDRDRLGRIAWSANLDWQYDSIGDESLPAWEDLESHQQEPWCRYAEAVATAVRSPASAIDLAAEAARIVRTIGGSGGHTKQTDVDKIAIERRYHDLEPDMDPVDASFRAETEWVEARLRAISGRAPAPTEEPRRD